MIRIRDVKISEDLTNEELLNFVCKKYKIKNENVRDFRIFKKSIDARDKSNVFYVYTFDLSLINETNENRFEKVEIEKAELKINVRRVFKQRPIVIGCGPSGIFSALILARYGANPIIIEQGKSVEDRVCDVELFWNERILNIASNVQFGEGGAGTFSDGKLTTGVNSPLCNYVINEFYNFGAPEQILYVSKPHIGTDNLVHILKSMREEIIRLGGEFYFNEKVVDFNISEGKIESIVCQSGKTFNSDTVILAIGHSARDTFKKLYEKGINIEAKNFSVGVRIEHKQSLINESQYGNKTKLNLPPAEYKLAYHGENRSCYTFCMCPGGKVVASSSEENSVVTNGMSEFKRDGENANSALLVSITPEDFKEDLPLGGIRFQEKLEQKAFEVGGKNYNAPVQCVGDFLKHRKTEKLGKVIPTYKPGVTLSDLHDVLPEYVSKTLEEGLVYFDKKIKGFASDDAVLTGVETRSSSPVKIPRDELFEANIEGIYPCGEGAGYAGGIMTAAIDGIKCAKMILEK